MEEFTQEVKTRKQTAEITTFPVEFKLVRIQENLTINTNTSSETAKKEILNKAFYLHSQGRNLEAAKYYEYLINHGFNDERVFSNYGVIKKDYGKLHEAALLQRKAIEINPKFAEGYSNLGIVLRDLSELKEAELSLRKAIQIEPNFANALYNLGNILSDIGKLDEAKIYYIKAVELNPDFSQAHCNLGAILIDQGKFKEAEISLIKAIQINPKLTSIYYYLSKLKNSINNKILKDKIFSKNILYNQSKRNQVDIYFARANILHAEKKYLDSAKYLRLGNKLKLELKPSNPEILINRSKLLLIESKKQKIIQETDKDCPESIFIVGMPRSGSTLVESILSMNKNVNDLGEVNFLEKSFLEWNKTNKEYTLAELYWKKVNFRSNKLNITTNKYLYNYQYSGIILNQIPNSKIIHCYRNPLDNILSIYRAHFAKENNYSSSLTDCAKVYLDQEKIMTIYKNRFRSKIYELNYDLLVKNPNKGIQSLISWLGWKWEHSYLSPHLNQRSVSTASSVQVRSPINSKSIGGWKNYRDMLQPAFEILAQNHKYRDMPLHK